MPYRRDCGSQGASADRGPTGVSSALDGRLAQSAFRFRDGAGATVNDQRRTGQLCLASKPAPGPQAIRCDARGNAVRRPVGRRGRARADLRRPARGHAAQQNGAPDRPSGRRRFGAQVHAVLCPLF